MSTPFRGRYSPASRGGGAAGGGGGRGGDYRGGRGGGRGSYGRGGGRGAATTRRRRARRTSWIWAITGTLKGFDPLLNMVLDDAQEQMRNAEGEVKARPLGLAVVRGTHITTLHPVEGSESIANPYLAAATEAASSTTAGAANGGADGKVTPAYQYTPKAEEEESD
ncbi:small nuclear ribonucleoprotein [Niveomyces insectorum RCEF 264]|uniref:Small nuclear ribonucleoprotein n=1 Tax=Niveomyces insectorum RCEF 264 TaxID=1081102 RepID=A0A167W485_9HYPO|nr:small nuclear ribonucleoprotein [Niveomyces insectorum RCEF 264]